MLKSRDSINEPELLAAVWDFERVIKSSEWLCKRGERLAYLLCAFYAMWSAFAIRVRSGNCDRNKFLAVSDSVPVEDVFVGGEGLPTLDTVQNATQKFVAALRSHDGVGMWTALEVMGVPGLCPIPEEQLARTECVARCVSGRPQLIPLVELSLFAIELGDYAKARKYAVEARDFDPTSWELYNLRTAEGLIALNAGRRSEAIECLDRSITACQRDGYTLLSCGVRPPNLALAQRLLNDGAWVEVARHLLHCKDVWQVLRSQIDKWISNIEKGETPDFGGSGILKKANFAYRLQMQWMRALSVEGEQVSSTSKSLAEAIAERERLRTNYKRHMSAAKKGKLEGL
jgi:hypothetical protein